MRNPERQEILGFLRGQKLAVISTIHSDSDTPESALVAFSETRNLEVFFQTHREGRKAENLRSNPHVSFVFGLDEVSEGTVQYEGIAEEMRDPNEVEACKVGFIKRRSPTANPRFLDRPEATFFRVVPSWVGYTNYALSPPRVVEEWF